jgi:hypothetical protein
MSGRLLNGLVLGIAGLLVLRAVAPAISSVVGALVPLVLVAGILAALLKLVNYYTRR